MSAYRIIYCLSAGCFNFFKDFGTNELLEDRNLTDMEGDERTIVNLLTDQVEFANVIILNKTDLVDENTVGLLKTAIHKLNPGAKIIASQFGKVAPKEIWSNACCRIMSDICLIKRYGLTTLFQMTYNTF